MLKRIGIMMLVIVGASLFVANVSHSAVSFELSNKSGYTIYYLYVSPVNTQDWSDDHLGNTTLPNNESTTVTLPAIYNECNYNVRVVDEEGDNYTFTNQNLCNGGRIEVTIRNRD